MQVTIDLEKFDASMTDVRQAVALLYARIVHGQDLPADLEIPRRGIGPVIDGHFGAPGVTHLRLDASEPISGSPLATVADVEAAAVLYGYARYTWTDVELRTPLSLLCSDETIAGEVDRLAEKFDIEDNETTMIRHAGLTVDDGAEATAGLGR